MPPDISEQERCHFRTGSSEVLIELPGRVDDHKSRARQSPLRVGPGQFGDQGRLGQRFNSCEQRFMAQFGEDRIPDRDDPV